MAITIPDEVAPEEDLKGEIETGSSIYKVNPDLLTPKIVVQGIKAHTTRHDPYFGKAGKFLCDCLRLLGYDDGVDAFEKVVSQSCRACGAPIDD